MEQRSSAGVLEIKPKLEQNILKRQHGTATFFKGTAETNAHHHAFSELTNEWTTGRTAQTAGQGFISWTVAAATASELLLGPLGGIRFVNRQRRVLGIGDYTAGRCRRFGAAQ
ncbi:hypothetical protein AND_002471 [Anopheles darlingi]|uniref:Uncharacterized protein n=1 Tax=Anopheles darlingi TaxID=43151 RepID=W5JSM0_ANODA|nr:hypothetical protein AND_002471 [Anopheles darlingi]